VGSESSGDLIKKDIDDLIKKIIKKDIDDLIKKNYFFSTYTWLEIKNNIFKVYIPLKWRISISNYELEDKFFMSAKAWNGWQKPQLKK